MRPVSLCAALCAAACLLARVYAADADSQKVNTAVDALTRMENVNLEEKPAVKAAVERLLERTRGTPNFVRLVRHFKLTNQNAGLLEIAIKEADTESGVEAMRLVLASKDVAGIRSAMQGTNAARIVQALGGAKDKQAIPLLADALKQENAETGRAAVRALSQTREGAEVLLQAAGDDTMPENLRFLAGSELNAARWPEIKASAAKVLPMPAGQNSKPLPPVAELVKLKGNSATGAEVFRRESTGCIKCHKVGAEGQEVGPALTEIGTKLAREALYESILDPSAGISFGYEGWTVELKSGDEVYGIKVSETPEEVSIKDTNGIVTRFKRAEIASMRQGATSVMPSGLQATMSTQELVDLVEYLVSLKKPN